MPRQLHGIRSLHELSIELTSKCNLTCGMCSAWKGGRDGLAADLVVDLLTDARRLGARVFTPSGAEVFMRKDTVELLQEAQRLGFSEISVVTNGMNVPLHIEALARLPALRLHISIDGPEAIHDNLRGTGSYRKAVYGLVCAVDAGLPVTLKGVLMRPTLESAGHLVDLAVQHGLERVSFQPFQPEIAGLEEDHTPWVFPPSERATVARTLHALLVRARLSGVQVDTDALFPKIEPYLFDGRRPIPEGGCHLPSRFILVDGRGETYPCFFMRGQSMGNVTQGVRLRDIWHSPVQRRMQARGLEGRCPGCLAGRSDVECFNISVQPVHS